MESVAVIGLGIMGGAIARHLVEAGFDVIGCDPSREARRAAEFLGVRIVDAPGQVPEGAHGIILSLPGFAAAAAVVEELAALNGPRKVIETSTLGLGEKLTLRDRLAKGGHQTLDCPISGTGRQMQDKDVVLYASGDAADLDRVEPLLQSFSRRVLKLGPFGNGTRMKLIANHLVAVHNVAAAEAVLLGMEAGFSMETLLEAIGSGAGNSRMFELRGPNVADRCYSPAAMKLSLWSKDMELITAFVRDLDVATPLFDAVAPLYAAALDQGLGDQDTSAVAEILRGGRAGELLHKQDGD